MRFFYGEGPVRLKRHIRRGVLLAGLLSLGVSGASCHQMEQGYWTKQDVSQALTNEQYPADSQRCDRMALQDEGSRSETARAALYTKCMYARGYMWVVEEPMAQPGKTSGMAADHVESCPTGRRIVDAYGFPKCVPIGRRDRALSPEVKGEMRRETELVSTDGVAIGPSPAASSVEDDETPWVAKDRLCRRLAQDTLSSPYGVYTQCMQLEESTPAAGP